MSGAVPGTLRVSNDCIADLAGYAALECYGVVGMAEIDQEAGVARLLPSARIRKGIDVAACDGRVTIDMHVIVEQIAELQSVDVKVHIEGLRASR